MSDSEQQLNVTVAKAHRRIVEKLAEDNGWTLRDTVLKSIRALAGLMVLHDETANRLGGEPGAIHRRLVAELGPSEMANKPLEACEFDDGRRGLIIDGYGFALEDDGRLTATRRLGDRVEVYEVRSGGLVLVGAFGAGDPTLN
jgi:hypothetical protein